MPDTRQGSEVETVARARATREADGARREAEAAARARPDAPPHAAPPQTGPKDR